jgi:hypothetical protein
MTSGTIELVERIRHRLDEQEHPVRIVGPVPEAAISAAEEALGCTFPPSYRTFLRTFGGIALPTHLGVVGLGAESQEWFCLDVSREDAKGEYPVLMYDARDNALDQQFYDDFGQMLEEVMGFVAEALDQPLD